MPGSGCERRVSFFNHQAARLNVYVVYCIKLSASVSAYAENVKLGHGKLL